MTKVPRTELKSINKFKQNVLYAEQKQCDINMVRFLQQETYNETKKQVL